MPYNMSISVNGQYQVPPGFRFHPTEEELLQYYLRKKVAYEKIDLDVIRDVDLNKLEPWDIQEKSTPQNDWYFFSHKDKKYPTGTRTNRATAAGFWKATGRDKVIFSNSRRIGMRKTLVFYKGRAPHGQKSDWIMHEYRLLDDNCNADHVNINNVCNVNACGEGAQEEGWVVCRIFKKKNHQKSNVLDSPMMSTSSITFAGERRGRQRLIGSNEDDQGTLEQILEYMSRTCMEENDEQRRRIVSPLDTATSSCNGLRDRFMKLPGLESPNSSTSQTCYQQQPAPPININNVHFLEGDHHDHAASNSISSQVTVAGGAVVYQSETIAADQLNDWAALDRFVATHLNGQNEIMSSKLFAEPQPPTTHMTFCCPSEDHDMQLRSSSSSSNNRPAYLQDYHNECELWSFVRPSLSSADPLAHMSNVPV